ncbi:MAG: hypothetical protein IJV31_06915 [Clostridia bacterium]|nr:hypothetical protein [Clostridia bacterium]
MLTLANRGEVIYIKDNRYCYFVNNGEFFYEGQILSFYDIHNAYVCDVQILKFIKHYHRRNHVPYLCVSIKYLRGKKREVQTFNANTLGEYFTNKIKNFENF